MLCVKLRMLKGTVKGAGLLLVFLGTVMAATDEGCSTGDIVVVIVVVVRMEAKDEEPEEAAGVLAINDVADGTVGGFVTGGSGVETG